jgi:hypothetical protein
MTFSRHWSTGMEALAFQSGGGGACPLCGGAGAVPDPHKPSRLRPCPSCMPSPRRQDQRRQRVGDVTLGEIIWHGLVWSFYLSAGLLSLLLPAAIWQTLVG